MEIMKRKHAKLIHAYADGAEIELFNKHSKKWESVDHPKWAEDLSYRVKQKPEYIPFEWEDRELLRGKWIKNKENGSEWSVYHLNVNSDGFSVNHIDAFCLLNDYTFLDGSPCGKINNKKIK